jgi:hypothetical protein
VQDAGDAGVPPQGLLLQGGLPVVLWEPGGNRRLGCTAAVHL